MSGIGQAIARRMLREGACVVLADIDPKTLDEVQTQLRKEFGNGKRGKFHSLPALEQAGLPRG